MNILLLSLTLALPPLADIDALNRGDRGFCKTVFEDQKIETMDFSVKGVMHNTLGPGQDLVMIKLLGEKPSFTGVVAGMSGSPCYIGDKLIGALGYSFANFAKEPIAGVTPMRDMLDVFKQPEHTLPWRQAVAENEWKAFGAGEALVRSNGDSHEARPIATPLSVSGFSPRTRRHFAPWLESMGLMPMAGPGAAAGIPDGVGRFEEGAAIAAVVVRGDINIAATGTVTSVEGREVLAFGHPFLGIGPTSMPMATATILNTMASQQRSFKMSEPLMVIGELTQDRSSAIGGVMGQFAKMVPVSGQIKIGKETSSFKFDVARDYQLTPRFLAMALVESLSGRVATGQRGVMKTKTTISIEGEKDLVLRSTYAGQRESGLFIQPAVDIAQVFQGLWDNPFENPPSVSIHVDAVYEPRPFEEYVESVKVFPARPRVGEKVSVLASVRQLDGPVRKVRFDFEVPKSWRGRVFTLGVGGGAVANLYLNQRMAGVKVNSVEDIRRYWSKRFDEGDLYLFVSKKEGVLRKGTREFGEVPPSIIAATSGSATASVGKISIVHQQRQTATGVVYGGEFSVLSIAEQKY